MPRPAFHRLTPERQAEILDAAAERFAAEGFEGCSYNALIESLGLSKGSAYHAFEGKADLYAAVIAREFEQLASQIPTPKNTANRPAFWRAVRTWLGDSVQFLAQRPRLAALMQGYAIARQSGAIPNLDHALDAEAGVQLEALVKEGLRIGAVRKDLPPPLLANLAGAVLAAFDLHYLPRMGALKPKELEQTLDHYADALKRLLEP